jgi:hypothetical protein
MARDAAGGVGGVETGKRRWLDPGPRKSARRMGAGNHLCRLSARHLDQSDGSFGIMVAQASIITANAPRVRGTCGPPGGGNGRRPYVPAVV